MRALGRRLVPRSLRVRIMVTLVGLVVALGVVALINAANDIVDLLENELEQRGIAIATDVAARSAGPALTNDVFGLYQVVNEALINNPDVRYAFLVEPAGDVRVHTFVAGAPPGLVNANSVGAEGHTSVRVLKTTEGPTIDIAVPILEGQGGTVRVGMSKAGIRQVAVDRLTRLALLVAAASVAAVGASFFLASVLTGPLVRLAEAARNVGRGDLQEKVPVETTGELRDLALAFNSMTDALAESRDGLMDRNEELRILNKMADHLSRQPPGGELARTSLRKLLELTRLPAGWICLKDERGTLSLDACQGVRPAERGEASALDGSCECRAVLERGDAMHFSGYPACPLLSPQPSQFPDGVRRAVLPLFSGEGVIGVLTVCSEREFSPDRMELLTSVGQQIGIALENARLYRARGQLLEKLIVAQEEERKRIAREIHDDPAQVLSSSAMRLDQLRRRLPPEQGPERAEIEAARRLVRDAIDSLDRIMLELRPSALDDLGLVPAIRWYAEDRLAEAGIELDFRAGHGLPRLDPEIEVAVFRLVQEAVTNVYKHSDAECARIRIGLRDSMLSGSIEDDGHGFDPRALAHERTRQALGLAGMEERARLLGGALSINSVIGEGTRIAFDIPLQAKVGRTDEEAARTDR